MSADELIVTVVGLVIGPLLWTIWFVQMSRLRRCGRRGRALRAVGSALAVCTGLTWLVLRRAASPDVVDAPQYVFMYAVLGLAWARIAAESFPYAGLSLRDDVVERGNVAATITAICALIAATICYAGGNIGEGPGWWVVLFAAALATVTLFVSWIVLAQFSPASDAVLIDRDPAAGLRVGAYLIALSVMLGRAVAGDWVSAAETVRDFTAALPAAALLLAAALVIERVAKPTAERPQLPLIAFGVLPSLVYAVIAATTWSVLTGPAR